MALTNTSIQKALEINKAVDEYFATTDETVVPAKDLMNLFIQKGIFKSNHRDGLPIRDFLRRLDKEQRLDLIPRLHAERKRKNTFWYFVKPGVQFSRV